MNTKKLLELAESVKKHTENFIASGDLKDLTKAQVRARNYMAAALRIEEDKRKK